MLEIKNMTTTLGGNTILHNLNCNFESGVHGLLGPNGAGKTTFMRSLIGLYPSATGSILLNGANIHSVDIGYLPQKFGSRNDRKRMYALYCIFQGYFIM